MKIKQTAEKFLYSKMFIFILSIWLIFISGRFTALGMNYPECNGIEKFNTFVASKKSCSRYIFCDDENSFEGECLGDDVFNEKEGICDNPKDVQCNHLSNGSVNNNNGKTNGSSENEYNGSSSGSNNNNDLHNKTETANSDVIPSYNGYDAHNPITNSNADEQLQYVPKELPSQVSDPLSTGNPSNVFAEKPQCPQSYDQTNLIQLPNPTSCASYYTCYNGIPIAMICGRNMYFNRQSSKCEPKEQVHCPLERPVHLQCLKGIYDFMPHRSNCDYYYFCSNGFLMIFQCPFQFTWHYERRSCVHQSQSKCYSTSILQ